MIVRFSQQPQKRNSNKVTQSLNKLLIQLNTTYFFKGWKNISNPFHVIQPSVCQFDMSIHVILVFVSSYIKLKDTIVKFSSLRTFEMHNQSEYWDHSFSPIQHNLFNYIHEQLKYCHMRQDVQASAMSLLEWLLLVTQFQIYLKVILSR